MQTIFLKNFVFLLPRSHQPKHLSEYSTELHLCMYVCMCVCVCDQNASSVNSFHLCLSVNFHHMAYANHLQISSIYYQYPLQMWSNQYPIWNLLHIWKKQMFSIKCSQLRLFFPLWSVLFVAFQTYLPLLRLCYLLIALPFLWSHLAL